MYISEIPFATPEYDKAVFLRDLLLRKPLGKTLNIIGVRHEYKQVTLGAFDEIDHLLGVVMLKSQSGTTMKLRQMAVSEQHQGRGVGRALVEAAIEYANKSDIKRVTCHARSNVVGFYEKLGFKKKGDPFDELGIEHQEMQRSLT